MAGKGTLRIRILGDDSGLAKTLGGTGKLLSGLGKLALGAGVAIGAAIVGLGAFGLKSAITLDKAYDTIRTGTGATGKDLDGLKQSFKTVFKGVPADAETVGTALADLNTRTGQTGKGLEALTKQTVNLAKVTKTDVSTLVAATTRVFGDWSIATDKQSGAMDYLFKVSQNTGIGVDALAQTVVQFGAPLRQLGFDFETSAAMLGKWEKEGVNLETVLAGMKFGLGGFAKAGLDAKEALIEVSDKIKTAGTLAEANKIAIETFGKRAGPDMAAAIREGRFDLDALLATLEASPETINKAAEATYDFGERWIMAKNKLMLVFEPLGIKLMEILDKLASWVDEHMPEIQAAFETVFAAIGVAVDWVREHVIPPLQEGLAKFRDWWAGPEGGAVISGVWTTIKTVAGGVKAYIADVVVPVIKDILGRFEAWWSEHGASVATVFAAIRDAAAKVVGWIQANWGTISTVMKTVWAIAVVPLQLMADMIGKQFDAAAKVVNYIRDHWGEITGKVQSVWNAIAGPLTKMYNAFVAVKNAIGWAIDKLKLFNSTPVSTKSPAAPSVLSPHTPKFQAGGPIPGSGPMPIIAHGGEYMLTRGDTSLMRELIAAVKSGRGGGMGPITINVLAGPTPTATADAVASKLLALGLA